MRSLVGSARGAAGDLGVLASVGEATVPEEELASSLRIEEVGGGIGEGVLAGAAVEDADDSVLRSVDVTAENILVR